MTPAAVVAAMLADLGTYLMVPRQVREAAELGFGQSLEMAVAAKVLGLLVLLFLLGRVRGRSRGLALAIVVGICGVGVWSNLSALQQVRQYQTLLPAETNAPVLTPNPAERWERGRITDGAR